MEEDALISATQRRREDAGEEALHVILEYACRFNIGQLVQVTQNLLSDPLEDEKLETRVRVALLTNSLKHPTASLADNLELFLDQWYYVAKACLPNKMGPRDTYQVMRNEFIVQAALELIEDPEDLAQYLSFWFGDGEDENETDEKAQLEAELRRQIEQHARDVWRVKAAEAEEPKGRTTRAAAAAAAAAGKKRKKSQVEKDALKAARKRIIAFETAHDHEKLENDFSNVLQVLQEKLSLGPSVLETLLAHPLAKKQIAALKKGDLQRVRHLTHDETVRTKQPEQEEKLESDEDVAMAGDDEEEEEEEEEEKEEEKEEDEEEEEEEENAEETVSDGEDTEVERPPRKRMAKEQSSDVVKKLNKAAKSLKSHGRDPLGWSRGVAKAVRASEGKFDRPHPNAKKHKMNLKDDIAETGESSDSADEAEPEPLRLSTPPRAKKRQPLSPTKKRKSSRAFHQKKRRSKRPKRRKPGRMRWNDVEVENLKIGVEEYGAGNWARILSEYYFQEGRTSVHLKDKYRNLEKNS